MTTSDIGERGIDNEEDAIRALVTRHHALVFGVALSVTHDAALAEDLVQEVFIEAWRALPRLRDRARVRAWLAGIARNLARNALRRRGRRRLPEEPGHEGATPLQQVLVHESHELLRRCLAEIPESYREALVLFYLEEQSVSQVARGLGVTEELVKQRLSRGRRSLREGVLAQLDTALGQARPGAAVTAGVVAAVALSTSKQAAAAVARKVVLGMSLKKAAVVVAVVVAVALAGSAAWYGVRGRTESAPRPAAATEPPPRVKTTAERAAAPAPTDKAGWDELRGRIRQARERREAQRPAARPAVRSSPGVAPASQPAGSLGKDEIRSAMKEILPLVKECHDRAFERVGAAADGRLVVRFTIEGEPAVGGVVSESELDEASTATDPLMRECVQQSMYALRLSAPRNGGTVRVTYPFVFKPDRAGTARDQTPAR